eukprot:jgi/Tetstr1/424880/TSEL_015375.t1
MCGHGDGSLTKRGSQGAYVLLALRRDACGASSPPSQIREPTILAEGSNLAGEPPRSAAKDFRAQPPPPTDQSTNREAFPPLPEFRAHLEKCRASSQEGKARFAGLSTSLEYAALLRVCREQDVHCIRKKGKKPASERAKGLVEQPGDPQRRYYLRSGNWELDVCRLTGAPILSRCAPERGGIKQVWASEDNVEHYLWDIHNRQLNHGGMDKTWAAVQQQLYGCTQSLCRVYVVSCQCVQKKTRNPKRKAAQVVGDSQ